MIKICEPVYSTDGISERENRIIKHLKRGKKTGGVYCIIFSSNPENLFDILSEDDLLSPYYSEYDPEVIGLAESKDDAILLVKELLKEVYEKTGDFKVRDYFRPRYNK